MATPTVRTLDDGIAQALRMRAAEHGRSPEAEHRESLRIAPSGERRLPNYFKIPERVERRHTPVIPIFALPEHTGHSPKAGLVVTMIEVCLEATG